MARGGRPWRDSRRRGCGTQTLFCHGPTGRPQLSLHLPTPARPPRPPAPLSPHPLAAPQGEALGDGWAPNPHRLMKEEALARARCPACLGQRSPTRVVGKGTEGEREWREWEGKGWVGAARSRGGRPHPRAGGWPKNTRTLAEALCPPPPFSFRPRLWALHSPGCGALVTVKAAGVVVGAGALPRPRAPPPLRRPSVRPAAVAAAAAPADGRRGRGAFAFATGRRQGPIFTPGPVASPPLFPDAPAVDVLFAFRPASRPPSQLWGTSTPSHCSSQPLPPLRRRGW